jgi:hypothetical protein
MMKSFSESIDLQPVYSIYIPRDETCFDRLYQYFWYYCCCCSRVKK